MASHWIHSFSMVNRPYPTHIPPTFDVPFDLAGPPVLVRRPLATLLHLENRATTRQHVMNRLLIWLRSEGIDISREFIPPRSLQQLMSFYVFGQLVSLATVIVRLRHQFTQCV